jgi:hypothetical protein
MVGVASSAIPSLMKILQYIRRLLREQTYKS